jgi:hypothetical protein
LTAGGALLRKRLRFWRRRGADGEGVRNETLDIPASELRLSSLNRIVAYLEGAPQRPAVIFALNAQAGGDANALKKAG